MAALGFFIFLSVMYAADAYLFSRGFNSFFFSFNSFFFKYKTDEEKELRQAIIDKAKRESKESSHG